MTRPAIVTLAAALAIAASACGGSDDASDRTSNDLSDTTSNTTTVTETTISETTIDETTPPTTPDTTAAPATTEPTVPIADPWQPVDAGPYEVGVATITLDDPARPLTVDVWFPLDPLADVAGLELQRYTLLPGVYYESPAAFAATPAHAASDGPFPLVVYSHGSGGLRYIHSSYTEGLAGHGYVVVAADHTGNTAVDRIAGADTDGEQIVFDRPSDVGRLIDAFSDPSHPTAGAYASTVDADRVTVTGHSFGGFTAIAAVTGFSSEIGDVPPDDRVDAIVPLAPAVGERLTDDVLAMIDVPMMIVVGTDDVTTPVDPNVTRLWEATAETSSPAYRVELVAGEHQTFTDVCAYQDDVPTLPDVPAVVSELIDLYAEEGCSEGDIDAARATELTNSYVVRFLDQVFRDGPAIDPAVTTTPDDVIFDAR